MLGEISLKDDIFYKKLKVYLIKQSAVENNYHNLYMFLQCHFSKQLLSMQRVCTE
jgi:hypothetical protein